MDIVQFIITRQKSKAGSVLWIDDASVTLPTGISQVLENENSMEIFPNPENGVFSIRQNIAESKPQTIEIYNNLREKLYSKINDKQPIIDISNSPKGIYFVKLSDGEKFYSRKIIVL